MAILFKRSVELALAELAILKCGAAYAPLDQNAPAARQAYMIEDCQAEIVLAGEDLEVAAGVNVTRVNIKALSPGEEAIHNQRITLDSRNGGVRHIHIGFDRAAQGSGRSPSSHRTAGAQQPVCGLRGQ